MPSHNPHQPGSSEPAPAPRTAGWVAAWGLCCALGLYAGQCAGQVSTPPGSSVNLSTHPATPDDMGSFLARKGLTERLGEQAERLGEQVGNAGRAVGNKASELVVTAMGFLGVPYKRGGNNFDQGFDCSGFVKAMFEQTVGLVLPRRSSEQAAATQAIEPGDMQPGDLVFFNTLKSTFSHVGIYVGDNKFIHSPRSGAVVRVEDMRVAYWSRRFDGARRVAVQGSATPSPLPAATP